ncbi:MAG: hypothetical protein Q9163_002263 [Psora crenata]
MPVLVIYHPECDQNFRSDYHSAFQQWINNNPVHTNQNIRFDQALVLNGLHPTSSFYDPNPDPHVTVQLSTPALRAQRQWYVLHWRPDGGSVVLRRPDSEEANEKRKTRRKGKKQRRRQRDKDAKDSRGGRGGGSGASTTMGALQLPFSVSEDEELLKEDRDFIMRMMKLDPRDRPTAKDLLQDGWFKS